MAANYSSYDASVRRFVSGVLGLDLVHLGVTFYELLHAHNEEYWVIRLISTTIPEMKAMLNADRPPTWAELGTLPTAVGRMELGTYFLLADSPPGHGDFGYNGSATALEGMMAKRVGDHLNPEFRKRLRERQQSTYLYNIMDDRKTRRSVRAAVTGAFPGLEDGTPDSIIEMRLTCKLHETMMQVFLHTYMPGKPGTVRELLKLMGPWPDADVKWRPTNGSVPLLEAFQVPELTVDIDPEVRIDHKRARYRARWASKSAEERQRKWDVRAAWREQIVEPCDKMRESGVSESMISRWKAVALKKRGKWLKMDAATRPPRPDLPPSVIPMPRPRPGANRRIKTWQDLVPTWQDISAPPRATTATETSDAVVEDFHKMEEKVLVWQQWHE